MNQLNALSNRVEYYGAQVTLGGELRVLDMEAGAGYTTELLARAVGRNGVVYVQDSAEIIKRQIVRHQRL